MAVKTRAILTEEDLYNIRKHADGVEELKPKLLKCHYCKHNAIKIFSDTKGHVQVRCDRCGRETLHHVELRRNNMFNFGFMRIAR